MLSVPSEIDFERIQVEVDAEYKFNLSLDQDNGFTTGRLDDRPFAKGGMKVVFNVSLAAYPHLY